MKDIAVLSMVSAAVSFLISEAKITRRVRGIYEPLFGCGYCVGHWVSLFLCLWFGVKIYESYLVAVLLIAWLSGIQWAAMRRLVGDD